MNALYCGVHRLAVAHLFWCSLSCGGGCGSLPDSPTPARLLQMAEQSVPGVLCPLFLLACTVGRLSSVSQSRRSSPGTSRSLAGRIGGGGGRGVAIRYSFVMDKQPMLVFEPT